MLHTRPFCRVVVVGLGLLTACASGQEAAPATPVAAPVIAAPESVAAAPVAIDEAHMFDTLSRLASDDMAGRYTLAPEIDRAASLLAAEYQQAGVQPVGNDYKVGFPVITGAKVTGEHALSIERKGRPTRVKSSQFVPLAAGSGGRATGDVVFVGYGVTAEAVPAKDEEVGHKGYDDFAGVDLRGKVALVLADTPGRPSLRAMFRHLRKETQRFEDAAKPLRAANDVEGMKQLHVDARKRVGAAIKPLLGNIVLPAAFFAAPADPLEPFDVMATLAPLARQMENQPGPKFDYRAENLREKLTRLHELGATAAIVVRGPRSFIDDDSRKADALPALDGNTDTGEPLPMPAVWLKWRDADRLFAINGKKLSHVQAQIDTALEPASQLIPGTRATVTSSIEPTTAMVPNVLAQIPGSDLAHEIVLIGAHYDHIGMAVEGKGHCTKLDDGNGNEDLICNGADDNASGSAMVLEIARTWAARKFEPRRTVVFTHFAGEELGLLGSRALSERLPAASPFTNGKIVAMVNLDMVGRLGPKGVAIGGLSSSPAWEPLLQRIGTHGLDTLYERSIASRSDHANFYRKDIPVLFFFTNVHADYHRAGDHAEKINREGMAKIAAVVDDVMFALSDGVAMPFSKPTFAAEGLVNGLPGSNPDTVVKLSAP